MSIFGACTQAQKTEGDLTFSAELETFVLDCSLLDAKMQKRPGVAFRQSKDATDKVKGNIAKWGEVVKGIDQGDGWLKVGDLYLPMQHQGIDLLKRSTGAEEATTSVVRGLPSPSRVSRKDADASTKDAKASEPAAEPASEPAAEPAAEPAPPTMPQEQSSAGAREPWCRRPSVGTWHQQAVRFTPAVASHDEAAAVEELTIKQQTDALEETVEAEVMWSHLPSVGTWLHQKPRRRTHIESVPSAEKEIEADVCAKKIDEEEEVAQQGVQWQTNGHSELVEEGMEAEQVFTHEFVKPAAVEPETKEAADTEDFNLVQACADEVECKPADVAAGEDTEESEDVKSLGTDQEVEELAAKESRDWEVVEDAVDEVKTEQS